MRDWLADFANESERLARAARRAGLDAGVPSCPGWDVAALAVHTSRAHRWATTIVDEQRTTPWLPTDWGSPADRSQSIVFFEDGAKRFLEVFGAVDPDTSVWTWGPGGTARWWLRRQAHETLIHGWDAANAAGDAGDLDAELAVDGIDEFLANVTSVPGVWERLGPVVGGRSLHLHCTDTDGEWIVRGSADRLDVERAHEKGDVAVRGRASDLDLVLFGRKPVTAVDVIGDAALFDAWLAATSY